MKLTHYIYLAALTVGMSVSLPSCLDFDTPADEFSQNVEVKSDVIYHGNADSLNYDYQPTEEEVNTALSELNNDLMSLMTAQYYLVGGKNGTGPQEHQYQVLYSLYTDNICGYTCLINSSFMAGTIMHTYQYADNYMESPYGRLQSMKQYTANFLNRDEANHIVELKAIGLLLFDYVAQEMVDIYGAIPFVDYLGNKETNPFTFNKGADIYATILNHLDKIDAVFENFENRPQWYKDQVGGKLAFIDKLSQTKDVAAWRRLANSLKLRMAMHLVKKDPEKARTLAEEAVAAGVVENKTHEMGYFSLTGESGMHPLKVIMMDWNDVRINASFISMLSSLKHPWLEYLIEKNNEKIINDATGDVMPANTAIVGVRAGDIMLGSQQYFSNMRCAYSRFNRNHDDFLWMPVYCLKWAEMDFLRAEGALRGWDMGGNPETFYYRGIENADCGDRFEFVTGEYDSRLADYLNVDEAAPYEYVDPMNYSNNIESVTHIGVKWNDSDDPETKLEKIITQKYIALFPYSYEAWTEMRRTGYPYIFPVKNAPAGDGSLSEGEMLHRFHLPFGRTTAGEEDVQNSGLEAIGGEDTYKTRVFWDIQAPNF